MRAKSWVIKHCCGWEIDIAMSVGVCVCAGTQAPGGIGIPEEAYRVLAAPGPSSVTMQEMWGRRPRTVMQPTPAHCQQWTSPKAPQRTGPPPGGGGGGGWKRGRGVC